MSAHPHAAGRFARSEPEARRAQNLRRLRVAAGLHQPALALKLGTKPTYVVAIEAGGRAITLRTIDKLATVLRLTSAQVLAELDRPLAAATRAA